MKSGGKVREQNISQHKNFEITYFSVLNNLKLHTLEPSIRQVAAVNCILKSLKLH
jgi:hypothetical protein